MRFRSYICILITLISVACTKKKAQTEARRCVLYENLWGRVCAGAQMHSCTLTNSGDIAAVREALNEIIKAPTGLTDAVAEFRKKTTATPQEIAAFKALLEKDCWDVQRRLFLTLANTLGKDKELMEVLKGMLRRSPSEFPTLNLAYSDVEILKVAEKINFIHFQEPKAIEELMTLLNTQKLIQLELEPPNPDNSPRPKLDSNAELKHLQLAFEKAEILRNAILAWINRNGRKF